MAAKRTSTESSRPATRAAVSIGSALGMVASRVDDWLAQREDIAQELDAVIGRAKDMLASLGKEATEARRQATRTINTAKKAATRTRRNMSAASQKRRAAGTKDPR